MDELIIILVRGLIKLFGGDVSKRSPQSIGTPWTPAPPATQANPQARTTTTANVFSVKPSKQRRAGRRPPPPIPKAVPAQAVTQVLAPPSKTATVAKGHEKVSVNAVTLHRWLTPQTLRKQFILTEVFQPPLALRENR